MKEFIKFFQPTRNEIPSDLDLSAQDFTFLFPKMQFLTFVIGRELRFHPVFGIKDLGKNFLIRLIGLNMP